jgi:PPOX class probable FMN-dependent enzyme
MGYPCRVTLAAQSLLYFRVVRDPAQGEGNARLRNAALNRKEVAMIDFESSPVASIDGLRALYAQPNERVAKKPLDHVNEVGRAFIAASPFLVLATGSRQGLDCSPKGDHPGFVQVAEDGRTLFIPDRRGNNRIDGLKNLIEDPRIALIFFVPGVNETYRVHGRAQISQDADLKRRFAVNGKEPATVMVVTVEETFQHCAKALVRSDLWKAGSRGRPQGVPTIGDFVAARNPGTDSAAFNVTYNERIPRELY